MCRCFPVCYISAGGTFSALMHRLDAFGIRYPFEAVEPEYDMEKDVRRELEAMLDRARIQAGLPPRQRWRKGTVREVTARLHEVDKMNGREFEKWCAELLLAADFDTAEVTQYSGDAGVDIIAEKDGERWAVQCKRYKNHVGNSAVQEVVAGMALYHCQKSLIITSSWYTKPAQKLARSNGTQLWDRLKVRSVLENRLV